jgi:AmmeMemoRadiSam system protein A
MPHPPIVVPGVGRGAEKDAQATIDAMKRVADEIALGAPDTIVLSSPHAPFFSDYFFISGGERLSGDFASFRSPEVRLEFDNNTELAESIREMAKREGISAGSLSEGARERLRLSGRLDHGAMVPLYYISQAYRDFKLVHVSTPFLPPADLYELGKCVERAVRESDEKVVYVASADLSHRLTRDAPAGYSPRGAEYDRQLIDKLKEADIRGILASDQTFMEEAGECGTRSIMIMLGAMSGKAVQTDLYSYEGPFGVGYLVARVSAADGGKDQAGEKQETGEASPHVRLARETLEAFVRDGKKTGVPGWVPAEFLSSRAGVFVSLKKGGRLRGCIGTISPVRRSMAEEIIENAISAGTQDPRFEPVTAKELSRLVYSVDVLGKPESIETIDDLDVKKYGVIVASGFKRGLLLPDLEGVDTPEEQVSIALRKAGISSYEDYSMERFRVERFK